MPIKVQCACGKAFAAKDELAGKTVKCPSCQQPLKITPAGSGNNKPAPAKPANPAAKPAAAKVGASKAVPPKAAPPKPPAAPPATRVDDLFDEIGLAPAVEGARPCPGCSEPMPIEAVLCIKCGYNTRIGRRMHTEVESAAAEGGHGAVAQDLLNKAAGELEGDAEAEKKKTHEGLPWWVYLIILIVLISVAAAMLMRGGKKEETEGEKTGFVPTRAHAVG